MTRTVPFTIICLFATSHTDAQRKLPENFYARIVELNVEYSSNDDADNTEIIDQISYFVLHPVNINTASELDLSKLPSIQIAEIDAIIRHRKTYGNFVSIYELQAVEGLEQERILLLSYFLRTGSETSGASTLKKNIQNASHELLMLVSTETHKRQGIKNDASRFRKAIRYKFSNPGKFSIGISAENDAGESFTSRGKFPKFDFLAFHCYVQSYRRLKNICIGDFQFGSGLGLTMGSGLSLGKSANAANAPSNGTMLRPYRALSENGFLRGVGFSLPLGKFTITPFYSQKFWDANALSTSDTLDVPDGFSSLNLTGYHRTEKELQNRQKALRRTMGGNVQFTSKKFQIGITVIHENISLKNETKEERHRMFSFSKSNWIKVGTDYSFFIKNTKFYGEFVPISISSIGCINGMITSLAKNCDLSLIYRNYPVNFNNEWSNAMSEASCENEKGLYSGLRLRPVRKLTLNLYADMYVFPWLKYLSDIPGEGCEYLIDANYAFSKECIAYIRYRNTGKLRNLSENTTVTNQPLENTTQNLRFHIDSKVSKRADMATRIEYVSYSNGVDQKRGYLIYHDIVYKIRSNPKLRLTLRWTAFDADDYFSRLFSYENDVLYSFSIKQLYGKGTRCYIMLDGNIARNVAFWIRYSRTQYNGLVESGAGFDKVTSDHRGDIKLQLRFKF